MLNILQKKLAQQRKAEVINRKRNEQLKQEINELLTRIKFEQECG